MNVPFAIFLQLTVYDVHAHATNSIEWNRDNTRSEVIDVHVGYVKQFHLLD